MGKFSCYKQRNDNLASLGYADYAAYLASDQWRDIRFQVLKRSTKCLIGEANGLLVPICHACHDEIEFTPDREKRSLDGANSALASKLEKVNPGLLHCLFPKFRPFQQREQNKRSENRSKKKQKLPQSVVSTAKPKIVKQRKKKYGKCGKQRKFKTTKPPVYFKLARPIDFDEHVARIRQRIESRKQSEALA